MLVSSLLSASSEASLAVDIYDCSVGFEYSLLADKFVAILAAQFRLQLQMEYALLWVVISGQICLSLYSWYQSGQKKLVSESAYGLNLALEIVVFSILIYLSGGATNPFVFYYLVPLAVGVSYTRQT